MLTVTQTYSAATSRTSICLERLAPRDLLSTRTGHPLQTHPRPAFTSTPVTHQPATLPARAAHRRHTYLAAL